MNGPRQFLRGTVTRVEDVPPGRFRNQLDRLPPQARTRAAAWLRDFHFTEHDLRTLHADPEGAIFYVDTFTLESAAAETAETDPVTAAAAVPVAPFPAGLVFHSKPGAPNAIYLNFAGATITNTAWNTSENRSSFQAVAFSTDSDFNTFSDAEQTAIRRIWQRVAEDYASFNVDVTTERPSAFTTRTAMALITRSTDATGASNPSSSGGGVAYINVFGNSSFANYRPAWVYHDNLSNSESYIAEATSHEIGHNMGLSHDGLTTGADYYGGHGTGETSWGPLMGTGYNRNVSQWSKGEYYQANNTQDDLALISAKLSYATDDHGDAIANATALIISSGTNISSTTPETDPVNSSSANKGILERNTDVDVFSFDTESGNVRLNVKPWLVASGTRGGNLDASLELRDSDNNIVATNNSATQTGGQIQLSVTEGRYYLLIRNSGAGSPLTASPSGYTSYGSIGQYFISGHIASPQPVQPMVQLNITVNNPAWGAVSPGNGSYPAGTEVQLTATPASYYQFANWTNGASGSNSSLNIVLSTNTSVEAVFREALTTNSPTPLWWLAAHGFGTNPEAAVTQIGSNGMPVWQSYVAGLDPNNPDDQLRIGLQRQLNADVLSWNTVTGRAYTIHSGPDVAGPMTPVSGAANLPAGTKSFTNAAPTSEMRFYRLEVKKP